MSKQRTSSKKQTAQAPLATKLPSTLPELDERQVFYKRVKLIESVPAVLLGIFLVLSLVDRHLVNTGNKALVGFHIVLIPWLWVILPAIMVYNFWLLKQAATLKTGKRLIIGGYICAVLTYLVVLSSPTRVF